MKQPSSTSARRPAKKPQSGTTPKKKTSADFPNVEATLLHQPCPRPECGSSDAMTLYSDGHGWCFACDQFIKAEMLKDSYKASPSGTLKPLPQKTTANNEDFQTFLASCTISPLKSRQISLETCKFGSYYTRRNPRNNHWEQVVECPDKNGRTVALKVRDCGLDGTAKEFYFVGDAKKVAPLLGMTMFAPGGKILTVVEGEIDWLTMLQVSDHRYPVVTGLKGAGETAKAVAAALEYVSSFDKVVFLTDMDGPGRDAALECAKLLPPGKAFIGHLSEKDPNACLLAGKQTELSGAVWNARPYRPDGIIDARELTGRCLDAPVWGTPWPWHFMTKWTYGRRGGEVYTIGAGTGIGKTDFENEVIASTITGKTKEGDLFPAEGFGVFGYEAGAATTKKAIAGKIWRRRFHIPNEDDNPMWTDEELREAMAYMDTEVWNTGGKLFINDSNGCADWEAVKDRARYLNKAEGIVNFLVDPISAVVVNADDERKALDALVLEAAQLSVELNSKFYLASHLTRPDQGPSHEEGGKVVLKQFRGSNGIGMFSNFVFGLERNQQAEDELERTRTLVRVVKDRYTGNSIGKTTALFYDTLAGTLDEPATSTTYEDAPL